jgi:uncharacterized protein
VIIVIKKDKEEKLKIISKMKFLSPWVHTTNKCNLKCGYCHVEQNKKELSKENYEKMFSQFKKLIDLKKIDFINLRISGGEPLLTFNNWAKQTQKFLEETKGKSKAEILTNLSQIPENFIEYISKQKNMMNVSLDSTTFSKPFHNGKSSAKKVMKNIEKVTKYKPVFIMTVLTENGKHLPDLAEYILDKGFKWEIQLNKFYEQEIKTKEVKHNLRKVVEIFHNKKVSILENLIFNFCDFTQDRACKAGQELFYIETNGEIYPCQMQNNGKPLTKIGDENLLEILEKNKNSKIINKKCSPCSIEDYCHGDCPINNTSKRKEYFCEIMKDYFLVAGKVALKQLQKE